MEVIDEGDGTVDTNYMADITATHGTWDPWPTPAQDTNLFQPKMPPYHLKRTQHQLKRSEDRISFIFLLFRYSFRVFSFSFIYLPSTFYNFLNSLQFLNYA